MEHESAFGSKGPWRKARYRKIGRGIAALLIGLVMSGMVAATYFTVMGLARWLHVPGYVTVPASLWILGLVVLRAMGFIGKKEK